MDKLQWFKFTPTDWVMGKIQRCPEITQARFMRLICLYWNKECVLSLEDAEIEIDKEHLDILVSKKIIKLEDDFLVIDFLNEQFDNIAETSEKRRKAVLQRWAKVKQKDTSVSKKDTIVLQNDTEKSREEKEKEKEYIINVRKLKFADTLKPFIDIYGRDLIKDFYGYWTEPNKSNTKFKQELQKTWDTKRRLDNWSKNDTNFNKNKNGKSNITDSEQFKELTKSIRSAGDRI